MPKTATAKTTNAQRAYQDLRRMILNNEIPAGSVYFEPELAEMLGVNRVLAHEAAVILAREGLVEVRPRRGVRVLPISAEDMREIYDILTELEALAAEQAAKNGLSAEQVRTFESVLTEMDKALADEDRQAWAEADERFHMTLVMAAGNERLTNIVETCNAQAHRARLLTLNLRPKPMKSNEDHRRVFNAICRQDPSEARAIHHSHRRKARDMLLDLLKTYGLQQL